MGNYNSKTSKSENYEYIYYADGKTVYKTIDKKKPNYKYVTIYAIDGVTKRESFRYLIDKNSESETLEQHMTYYTNGTSIYDVKEFEQDNIKKLIRHYSSSNEYYAIGFTEFHYNSILMKYTA